MGVRERREGGRGKMYVRVRKEVMEEVREKGGKDRMYVRVREKGGRGRMYVRVMEEVRERGGRGRMYIRVWERWRGKVMTYMKVRERGRSRMCMRVRERWRRRGRDVSALNQKKQLTLKCHPNTQQGIQNTHFPLN